MKSCNIWQLLSILTWQTSKACKPNTQTGLWCVKWHTGLDLSRKVTHISVYVAHTWEVLAINVVKLSRERWPNAKSIGHQTDFNIQPKKKKKEEAWLAPNYREQFTMLEWTCILTVYRLPLWSRCRYIYMFFNRCRYMYITLAHITESTWFICTIYIPCLLMILMQKKKSNIYD